MTLMNYSYQVKVKFVHHLLSSGKKNYSIKHACPFCKIQEHSQSPHDYFLVLPARKIKISRIAKLTACLTLLDTPNKITAIIIRRIKSFSYNSTHPPLNQLSPLFLNIQQHQEVIGWNHFTKGRVSDQIRDYMELFITKQIVKKLPLLGSTRLSN